MQNKKILIPNIILTQDFVFEQEEATRFSEGSPNVIGETYEGRRKILN
jgi:hypothetical protein